MTDVTYSGRESLPLQVIGMLQARNQAEREALSAMEYAAGQLCGTADDAKNSAYLSLMKEVCRLQYRIICSEELLNYEKPQVTAEAVDLCRTMRRFVNRTETLTGGKITIGECLIPHGLYAKVQPERLSFVLLSMLEDVLREMPEANTMDFTAECVQTELRIGMTLRRDPERNADAFVFSVPAAATEPDSPAELAKRFCESFGAGMLRQHADGKCISILKLPAACAENPLMKVSSDSVSKPDDMLYRAALSGFVPMEMILQNDEELL